LDELPKNLNQTIEIIPVDEVREVLDIALVRYCPRNRAPSRT
jgi:predicted ATP-dependent protease